MLRKRTQWLAAVLLAATVYYGAARLGFAISFVHGTVSAVWPPTGLALALVLIGGPRMLPAIFIGELAADVLNGSPPGLSLAFALGSTCEALAGYALLRRARFRPQLDRVRDVFALLGLAALLSTMVSATVATAALLVSGTIDPSELWGTWHVWWLGDVTGDVVLAPLLLVLASTVPSRPSTWRAAELTAFVLALAGLAAVARELTLGIAYLVLPVLIWAALRWRQLGAVCANAVLAGAGIVAAASASSALARVSVIERILFTQNFVVVGAITTLVLAAMIAERDRATRERAALGEITTAIAHEQSHQQVLAVIAHHAALLSAPERGVFGQEHSYPLPSTTQLLGRLADLSQLSIATTEARERLQHEATTDPLTGLANQRGFTRRLADEVRRARRYGRPLALVVLDLDGFKAINDAGGHAAGDRVLGGVARRITASVREDALAARLGGDELAVLLPESDGTGAYAVAERIRAAVATAPLDGAGLAVTISAGVADLEHCDEGEDLVAPADAALYEAKRLGGNTVVRSSPRLASERAA